MSERMSRPRQGARASPFAVVAVSTVLVLTACTAAPDDGATSPAFVTPPPPGGSSSSAGSGTSAASDDATVADVDFVAAMVVHHEQAVELARLADGRAADEELADLASRMQAAQAAEADAMRSWLGKRQSGGTGATDHGHDVGMRGEISRSTLDRAAEIDGPAFDALFLAAMVAHHRGAVQMAEARLGRAGDPGVARWARAIATAQSLEIDRMLEIEARLAGVTG
jgi:uncharacterized protein (DUF305 family)